MEFKDYYKTMGLDRGSAQDEIKRAYRKLARKYHPDVSSEADAEDKFKELGEAYEVLRDPEKRAAYDELFDRRKRGEQFESTADWNQGFEFHGEGFSAGESGAHSDFFESIFGYSKEGFSNSKVGDNSFRIRGEDTYARVMINLEDSYTGAVRQVTLKHFTLSEKGSPKLQERVINVKIPKGVCEGQHIRLVKQGDKIGGGEVGDLYLEVRFLPNKLFKLDMLDVYLTLPISPWEAALGATVKIPTPNSVVDLKIPPNSIGGQKLRLKGKGIPADIPGDMYAVIQIVLPKADSDSVKRAYEILQSSTQFNPRSNFGI